mgnify:CR=1 FL=1
MVAESKTEGGEYMLPHLLKRPDMYARTPNPEAWKPREESVRTLIIANASSLILMVLVGVSMIGVVKAQPALCNANHANQVGNYL